MGLVERARQRNVKSLFRILSADRKEWNDGRPLPKSWVFSLMSRDVASEATVWSLDVSTYETRSVHIKILERLNA